MAYFAVYAIDHPESGAKRTELRASHRQRLRDHSHDVEALIGGPLNDDAGNMIGTLLIFKAHEKAAVEHFMAGDPYVRSGIFKSMDIHNFNWGLGLVEENNG